MLNHQLIPQQNHKLIDSLFACLVMLYHSLYHPLNFIKKNFKEYLQSVKWFISISVLKVLGLGLDPSCLKD